MTWVDLIGQRLRALSSSGNTALFINLSGWSKETKTLQLIVFAISSYNTPSACVYEPAFSGAYEVILLNVFFEDCCVVFGKRQKKVQKKVNWGHLLAILGI